MKFSSLEKLTVKDLKTEANIMDPDTSISKVIGALRESGRYQVFTKIENKFGIISMRDILKVTNITSRKISSTYQHIPMVNLDQEIQNISSVMEKYRVRALPVVEDNEIIGEINSTSIVNAISQDTLKKFKIKSIMTPNPIVMTTKDLTTKAKKTMIQKRIDHIPVTENGKLKSVTTSSQIVFRMLPSQSVETGMWGAEKEKRLDYPLKMVFDEEPLTCEVEAKTSDVLEAMQKRNSTYSAVLLWDEIQGIVTYRDFLKIVAAEESKLDIPIYIVGLPEDPFEAESTRDKFLKTITGLKKSFPEIIEARSTIQTKLIRKDRRRYEVKAMIKTPKEIHSYSEEGYNLIEIFDLISDRMKRLMDNKRSKKREVSIREKK